MLDAEARPDVPSQHRVPEWNGRSQLVLYPYVSGGRWTFDDGDPDRPRAIGIDHILESFDAVDGQPFRLIVTTRRDGDGALTLRWIGTDESGGWNLYELEDGSTRGWLSPFVTRYFNCAPQKIYLRAEALPLPFTLPRD